MIVAGSKQSKDKILVSGTYKDQTRTLPALFEFDKESGKIKKLLDFENVILKENVTVIKDLIPFKGGYLITLEGYSNVNSSEGAEKTLWSLFQVTSDFKAVNSKSLIEEFGDVSLIKEALILSEGKPYIGFTYFPDFNGVFDFTKNEHQCDSYSTKIFRVTENLGFVKHTELKGDLIEVDTNEGNSLLTIVDNCDGSSQFIALDGKTSLTFPNYAVEANSAQLILVNGNRIILGDGDFRSSYLDQMFNYEPISEQTNITNFWENRDYMISEDSGSFLFMAPVEEDVVGEMISFKTSRMTSFISDAAVSGDNLFLSGTIDRDRAFLWKIPANVLE